jgi:inorganic pyrophosphatase
MEKDLIDILVETPKGSNLKYAYEPEQKLFSLRKVLPAGMCFPFDFGIISATKGDDGDPLDVIVLSEFKTFPGCLLKCSILGCMTAEQTKKQKTFRNDRYLAIPEVSKLFQHAQDVTDLPVGLINEIRSFFSNYLAAEDVSVKWLTILDTKNSLKTIEESRNR